ncbi:hypothetical protein SPACI_036180 [Sporomusa acidovorans DSM 3132]|uniref:DUF4292 domain-containing protein n=2 Tax=Sporomusa TaxID=2375 RepID=A0ABZ3J6H9_SPOA4|nr:DUF6612 family protein [Sporomusa acidovorans]OZC15661.1 hypothetical protein SPACI_47360 [Sporomusa acidovorans DSM 3132]SDE88413.1 hypothetical protein SAMN04488499_102533 [Sporomusa acidovorans]
MLRMKYWAMMIPVLLITIWSSICGAAPAVPAEITDYKTFVTQAYEKLHAQDNYHMTINTTGSMSIQGNKMDIMVSGECDAQTKPMVIKNVMNISLANASQKNEQKVIQYIEESKDQLTVYTNADNHWIKQSMPYYNPIDEYANYSQAIIGVELIGETAGSQVFSVTMDGSYLRKNIEQAIVSSGMKNIKLPESLFNGLGNFTYTVTIDKKTATISKMDMDMSGFLAAVGENIANLQEIPSGQKAAIREMFNQARLNTTVTFSKFNQVDKIVIPPEVKRDSLPTKYI